MSDALPYLNSSAKIIKEDGKMTPEFSKFTGNTRLFLDSFLSENGIKIPRHTTAELEKIAENGASLGPVLAYNTTIEEYVVLKKIPMTTNYRFEKLLTGVV